VDPPTDVASGAYNATFDSAPPPGAPEVPPSYNFTQSETCYLSTTGNDGTPCRYVLTVVIVTWAACLVLSIIQVRQGSTHA